MSATTVDTSRHVQGGFVRVFAGQLLLLVLTSALAVGVGATFGVSVALVAAVFFVALAALSVAGPALTTAAELTASPDGIDAKRYFGRTWKCSWSEVSCVLVFEGHSFGSRYRVKISSSSAGSIVVTDLVSDFEVFLDQLERFVPQAPRCPQRIIDRVLSG